MAAFRLLMLVFCLGAVNFPKICTQRPFDRVFKQGDAIIGSLLTVHSENAEDGCKNVFLPGINRVEAAVYTVEQINKNANILPSVKLGYDIRDYCMDRTKAMEHSYDFSTHIHFLDVDRDFSEQNITSSVCLQCSISNGNTTLPIAALVGPYSSRDSLQVAGLLQVVNIPAISPSATSEELSWSFYRNFLRAVPPDNFQARAMADLIDHFKWKYVAVIAVEDSYGLYGFRALEQESLQRETFCIGLVEYITPTRYESRLKPIVEKLKRTENIKVIILWIGSTIATDLAREAHRQNLKEKIWIMSDSLATKTPEYLGSDLMNLGIYLGIQPKQFNDANYEDYLRNLTPKITDNRLDSNDWFDFLWREEFNCSAKNNTPGYKQCPDDLTISNEVYFKMSDDFIPYQIDATYAIAHALDMIYKCREPLGLLAGGACPITHPFVSSADVYLYLRNVSFVGITGRVEFDENGDPLQALYDFVSFQRNHADAAGNDKYIKVKIGNWDANRIPEIKIDPSVIQWDYENVAVDNGTFGIPKSVCLEECPAGTRQTPTISCCWQCIECPDGAINSQKGATNCTKCAVTQKANENKTACVELPVENLQWGSTTGIILTMFTLVGFVSTTFTSIVFIRHLQSPIVKAANRELSFSLLIVITAGFILPVITISQPSQAICSLIEPWRYITSSLSVSILLVKTMKLLRAFQITSVAKWLKKVSASTGGQFASVILLNVVEVILAILWGTLDSPGTKTDIEKGKYILFTCTPYSTIVGLILEIAMLSYLIFLSLLCASYAFKARTLPENFNEARCIGFAMYILLLSWITFYPVQTSLEGWYVAVVSCTTALVSSYGLLACMFAPKVYVIFRHPEQNTAQFMRNELRTANSIVPVNYSYRASEKTSVEDGSDTKS